MGSGVGCDVGVGSGFTLGAGFGLALALGVAVADALEVPPLPAALLLRGLGACDVAFGRDVGAALGDAVGPSLAMAEPSGVAVAPATSPATGCSAEAGEGAANGEWPPVMPTTRVRLSAVVRLAVARGRQWGTVDSRCGACGPSASD